MLICHTLIHSNHSYVGNTIYLETLLEKGTIFFSSTFSLSCLTNAYISPLIECRLGEGKRCTKLGSLKYLFTSLICKEVLKTREGETFKLLLDLYFSYVGNLKCRIEH